MSFARRIILLTAALAVCLGGVAPTSAQNDTDRFAQIDRQVEAWQPTRDERRFDEIGWAPDLRAALKLAREHRRPVFLFTHDGRMNVGRC